MRVFISYAWENDEYRTLVKRLAKRLRDDGIDVQLDAWHLEGLTIPEFMSREVRHADKILVVCSPQYRQKVHAMEDGERITGTGWESMLVTSSIWANLSDRKKITPVLLRGTWREAAPDALIGLPYFDLSNMATFEANYRELLRSLTGQNEPVPLLGRVPEIAPEPVQPLRGPQSDAPTERSLGPEKPIKLRFEYREPCVQMTPVTDDSTRVYIRLFPECTGPVKDCTGYLLAIYRRTGKVWEPTVFNEAWPLTWANIGAQPVTVDPHIGPYLDVFYIGNDAKRIVPCIKLDGAPLRMVSPLLTPLFQSHDEVFRFDVVVNGSEPISLKVQLGDRWERPIVEVLPKENSN